jgi:hypothetical protein
LTAAALTAQQTPDPVIEAARKAAFVYQQSLPDYVAKRSTTRRTGARPFLFSSAEMVRVWRAEDSVTADIAVQHGAEVYANKVDGKPAQKLPGGGAWSSGEFAADLVQILAPESAALFTHPRRVAQEPPFASLRLCYRSVAFGVESIGRKLAGGTRPRALFARLVRDNLD